jgi:nitrate reductase gamma subunit
METMLDLLRGPIFRFSFAIMILGLARLIFLDLTAAIAAYRRAGDRTVNWKQVISRSLEWLIPVRRVFNSRPLHSLYSILFHVGLLLVPIFLYAHVRLWQADIPLGWPTLSKNWADLLTIATIVFSLLLFISRMVRRSSSFISRKQDMFWPLLLIIPFVTGFVCVNLNINPPAYDFFMLVHLVSGNLIFILIPFTKIAHCVLMPFSQLVSHVAWRFPPETDEAVCATLNKKGAPV